MTRAFWYSGLFLSVLGILQAAQQLAVLQLLGPPGGSVGEANADVKASMESYLPLILSPARTARQDAREPADDVPPQIWQPRLKMLFTWQCPVMFMSYSVIFFLVGLTIFICNPLVKERPWNTGCNVSTSN